MIPGSGRSPAERDRLPTLVFLGFPHCTDGKEFACNVGDPGSVPGWEDSLEEGMSAHSSIFAWRIPHGQRSLVGYSPRGHKELDMTE